MSVPSVITSVDRVLACVPTSKSFQPLLPSRTCIVLTYQAYPLLNQSVTNMTSLSPSNEANHTQPPIKLEDAPLRGGDIIMMRLPLDLTSHDTTSDITWTPTSGSGSPRHPVVWISGSDIPQNDGTTLTTVNVLVMRSFRTSQAASLVVQNSESSRFILPFPSPSSVDATPATPPEFGPSLRSPFFTPLYQTWLHARITRFDVLSNTMVRFIFCHLPHFIIRSYILPT